MTPTESAIRELFAPELASLRAEFGDEITQGVVVMLAQQISDQVREYEGEAKFLWQRSGRNPTYSVAVDFAGIKRDLRAARREEAVAQLAELRLAAELN